MQLTCSAVTPVLNELSCETWSFSHCGNPHCSPLSALSLSFPFSHPCLCGLLPLCRFYQSAPTSLYVMVHHLAEGPFIQPCLHSLQPCHRFCLSTHLTGLVGLVEGFFISLVVGVPCSLIFWHFSLFIDFRLVVILLLVVQGSKGFLSMPSSWLELPRSTFFFFFFFF